VLGAGGEAEVYDLGDGRALKLYKRADHPDVAGDPLREAAATARLAEAEAKLADFPRALPSTFVAPLGLARAVRGRAVIGYVMPKVAGTPMFTARRAAPPPRHGRSICAALVARSRRCTPACRAAHAAGVIIGDFNDGNVLVDGARCHLIDADSLQYGAWRCAMFTDRYVDPRLCDRTQPAPALVAPHDRDSDWFAFTAMLLRALVWVGPYGGVHQPADPAHRVAPAARPLRGPSVFGPEVIYPRSAAPLAGLPDALATYFRAVFDGGRRGEFPRGLLDELVLTRCPRCLIDHGRARCPACQHQVPTIAITRSISGAGDRSAPLAARGVAGRRDPDAGGAAGVADRRRADAHRPARSRGARPARRGRVARLGRRAARRRLLAGRRLRGRVYLRAGPPRRRRSRPAAGAARARRRSRLRAGRRSRVAVVAHQRRRPRALPARVRARRRGARDHRGAGRRRRLDGRPGRRLRRGAVPVRPHRRRHRPRRGRRRDRPRHAALRRHRAVVRERRRSVRHHGRPGHRQGRRPLTLPTGPARAVALSFTARPAGQESP
jgi:hypothetical protein